MDKNKVKKETKSIKYSFMFYFHNFKLSIISKNGNVFMNDFSFKIPTLENNSKC